MKLEEISFWHQVPLLDGTFTPGRVPIYRYRDLYLFSQINFINKTVLDIGCWDGYFCFAAEAEGAKEVVGLDNPEYRWGGMDGFNFLKNHFSSSVQWQLGSVYELPARTFDVILCYGVLYHLTDPLLAATNVFRMCNYQAVFEGLMFDDENPLLRLEPPNKFRSDDTNPYSMSTGWLKMVARMNGFKLVASNPTNDSETESRWAMLFERDSEIESRYRPYCFIKPPCERLLT